MEAAPLLRPARRRPRPVCRNLAQRVVSGVAQHVCRPARRRRPARVEIRRRVPRLETRFTVSRGAPAMHELHSASVTASGLGCSVSTDTTAKQSIASRRSSRDGGGVRDGWRSRRDEACCPPSPRDPHEEAYHPSRAIRTACPRWGFRRRARLEPALKGSCVLPALPASTNSWSLPSLLTVSRNAGCAARQVCKCTLAALGGRAACALR